MITGVPRVSLSRYANGVQSMTLGQLFRIQSSLGCKITDLVDDGEDLKSKEWRNIFNYVHRNLNLKEDKSWVANLMLIHQRQKDHVQKI